MYINTDRMISHMMKMIRMDSPTLKEKEVTDYLEAYLRERGAEIYRDNAHEKFGGSSGNLLAFFKGTLEGDPICFNAHLDTVEPGIGIEPVIKGDYVVSAGDTILGADDKAGIASILEALEAARENKLPHRDIYLLFTPCEEKGMWGAKHFDYDKLPCKDIVSVDAGGEAGIIAVGGPAKYGIVATFTGKKAHAGIEPEKGINAINMAASAICSLQFGRLDHETTANVGRIEGGAATNIVTDSVYFTAEVRSRSMEKLVKQVGIIEEACKAAAERFGGSVSIEIDKSYPSLVLDQDSNIYKKVSAAFAAENIPVKPTVIGGGGDCNMMSHLGYNCAIISCGMYDVHTSDERLNISELTVTAKVLLKLMTA